MAWYETFTDPINELFSPKTKNSPAPIAKAAKVNVASVTGGNAGVIPVVAKKTPAEIKAQEAETLKQNALRDVGKSQTAGEIAAKAAKLKAEEDAKVAMAAQEVKNRQTAKEAEDYTRAAQMTPEMQALMSQQRQMASGELSYADAMGQRLSDKASKEQMALAYARGYDPNAIRNAQKAGVEMQANIAQQTQEAKIKEQQIAQQGYLQALQYQQQISLSAEQAKKAYLMGNKELAQQNQVQMQTLQQQMTLANMDNQTKLEQIRASITTAGMQGATSTANQQMAIEAAAEQAKLQARQQQQAAILSGVATIGGTLAAGPIGGAAANTAANTLVTTGQPTNKYSNVG